MWWPEGVTGVGVTASVCVCVCVFLWKGKVHSSDNYAK